MNYNCTSWPQEAKLGPTTRSDGNIVLTHPKKQLPKHQCFHQKGMCSPRRQQDASWGAREGVGTADGGGVIAFATCVLADAVLVVTLWGLCHFHSYFIDEGTKVQ